MYFKNAGSPTSFLYHFDWNLEDVYVELDYSASSNLHSE
jgi:hypothetical protein